MAIKPQVYKKSVNNQVILIGKSLNYKGKHL